MGAMTEDEWRASNFNNGAVEDMIKQRDRAQQRVAELEAENQRLRAKDAQSERFVKEMLCMCGDSIHVANAALAIDWSQMNYGGPQPLPAFIKALEAYAAVRGKPSVPEQAKAWPDTEGPWWAFTPDSRVVACMAERCCGGVLHVQFVGRECSFAPASAYVDGTLCGYRYIKADVPKP